MNNTLFRLNTKDSWHTATHLVGWTIPQALSMQFASAKGVEQGRDALAAILRVAPEAVFTTIWLLGAYKLEARIVPMQYPGQIAYIETLKTNRLKVYAEGGGLEIRVKVKEASKSPQLDALVEGVW